MTSLNENDKKTASNQHSSQSERELRDLILVVLIAEFY